MTIAYLNGEFLDANAARISPMDRGFLFADGVYEVVPVFGGQPLRLEEHLRRLEYSLDELRIARPASREKLAALFLEMIRRHGGGDLSVYLQVTRGAPDKRDHGFPAATLAPTVFMTASPLGATAVDDPEKAAGGSAVTADDLRWLRCDIKSVSLLPNVLMRQKAVEAGAVETIMLRAGLLTEGSSTNVYVVRGGRVATPPLSPLILGGITRGLVLEVCRAAGIAVEERQVPEAELRDAEEIWVSSSTKDVLPIVKLDGKSLGTGTPGPVWKKLAAAYGQRKRELCGATRPATAEARTA